jgi:hypothetical protein
VNNQRALRIEPSVNAQNEFAPNFLGGFSGNFVTAGVSGATISGGGKTGNANAVRDSFGTIGGGYSNLVGNGTGTVEDAGFATIGGGEFNTATGLDATVGGGKGNNAGGGASYATVGGGTNNTAYGGSATIAGGQSNTASGAESTVAGGLSNSASGQNSTVGGGAANGASGAMSTVPGGFQNQAMGDGSFAAGHRAAAQHNGAFVWADSNDFIFQSAGVNELSARATGGVRFVTAINGSGTATVGAQLASGSGSWSSFSDRTLKENFKLLDGLDVLRKLSQIPITEWNYISQNDAIRHLGPTAQDFYAAFGLGEDDKHITTIDADGIALLSIQALYEMNLDQDKKIEELQERIKILEQEMQALKASLKK